MSLLSEIREAAVSNQPDRLRSLLLQSSLSVLEEEEESKNYKPPSPLQLALNASNFECISLLLEHGASLSNISKEGLRGGEIFNLEELFDLSLYLSSSPTPSHLPLPILSGPLRHAIKEGDTELLETILNKNDKISNYRDNMGLTPLHYLSIYNLDEHPRLMDMGRLLLEHGAKPNLTSRTDLSTPLHHACHHGNTPVVDLLLRESSDPELLLLRQDLLGRTPTHIAIYNEHWDLVSALVQSYRDLLASSEHIVDRKGYNVCGALFYCRCFSSSSLPPSHQLLTPCLSRSEADYCLHEAVAVGNEELLDHALEGGADPNVFDFIQQSPLILASKLGHHSVCQRLLSNGADPALPDDSGWSPLHYAAANGHKKVIEAILESREGEGSIDLYPVTNTGYTPLELSLLGRHVEVIQFILASTSQQTGGGGGGGGFNGDWMNLLSLVAPLNDMTILKDIVRLFCPHQWAKSLGNWTTAVLPPPLNEDKEKQDVMPKSFLKVLTPLPSPPTLYLKDILSPKTAQEKFKKHVEYLTLSGHHQFEDHPLFNSKEKTKSRKIRKPFNYVSNKSSTRATSPLYAMISAGNIPGLTFLIKEMRKANSLSLFLETKDKSGTSGATLLSRPLAEGLLSNDHRLESEVLQVLRAEYPLPGVSIRWGLLHLLTVKLASKVIIGGSPLLHWPELLITKEASKFVPSIRHDKLSSLNEVMKLASAILDSEDAEEIPVLHPMSSICACSLVCTAAVNGVDPKFLKLLLTKGNKSLPSSSTNCDSLWSSPAFALTKSIMRGYYKQAEVLLDEVCLSDMFSSLPPPPLDNDDNNDDDDDDTPRRRSVSSSCVAVVGDDSSLHGSGMERGDFVCDDDVIDDILWSPFLTQVFQAVHSLAASGSGEGFRLALRLLKEMPKKYFQYFLLLDESSRCLYLSLYFIEGRDFGVFLFEAFLKCLVDLVRSNEMRTDLLRKLIVVIESYDIPSRSRKWSYDRFDLFRSFVTYSLNNPCPPLSYLHELCGGGYTELVKLVFSLVKDEEDKGAETRRDLVLSTKHCGYTLLYVAANGGHVDIVQFLLEQPGVTLDPEEYGLYHPLLAVLVYFINVSISHQRNGYRACTRFSLDDKVTLYSSGYYRFSEIFRDPAQCKRLVSLVLPDPDQSNRLIQPLQYLLALANLHQHDLSPFANFLEVFPAAILSRVTHNEMKVHLKKDEVFLSDYILSTLRHIDSHPSPELCQKFVLDVVESLSPSNPYLAARYFYWDVVLSSIPSRPPRLVEDEVATCRWGEIMGTAVRRGETEVARSIVIELVKKEMEGESVGEATLCEVTVALCKSRKMFNLLKEKFLSLPLSDSVVMTGFLTAAEFGNFPALDSLADFKKSLFMENFNAILRTGAKAGQDEIIMFLSSEQKCVECLPGLEGSDASLSFWITVLEAAVYGGKTVIAFLAIGSLLQEESDAGGSLLSWSGFPGIVDSCCWWGLGAVLEGLNINEANVYLSQLEEHGNVTPFESAVQGGHYASLASHLSGFPKLESLQDVRQRSNVLVYDSGDKMKTLVEGLGRGWWRETMKSSDLLSRGRKEEDNEKDSTDLPLTVRADLFCFRGTSHSTFLHALECNIQVIVMSYLSCWGSGAGVMLQTIATYEGLVCKAVQSHSPELLQIILTKYFDAENKVEVKNFPNGAVCEALSQSNVRMLQILHKFNNLVTANDLRSGYSLLHLLAIHGNDSIEVTDYILSLDFEPLLLSKKDLDGKMPCESALSLGNYYTAGKLVEAMKGRGLTLPSIAQSASLAIGWFDGLMRLNQEEERSEDATDFILPAKGASLRNAKSLKEYYCSIRNYNDRAAGVLLDASLGELSQK